MTPEQVATWVAETRTRQGRGPTITDPDTLVELAAQVADAMVRHGPGHNDGGSRSTARRRLRKQPTTSQEATRQRRGADGS